MDVTRRQFIQQLGLGAVTASGLAPVLFQRGGAPPFSVPPLPYAFDALEPFIDGPTMRIHHDRHHQAYVDALNLASQTTSTLVSPGLESLLLDLASVPGPAQAVVRNQGGGHWNHSFFWQIMGPRAAAEPTAALRAAMDSSFGDFERFKGQFTAAVLGRFGSGWVWLVRDGPRLAIMSTANQDNPLMQGTRPADVLLGIDLWEHAYYLKYHHRRADYLAAWWHVLDWRTVDRRFALATGRRVR